MYISSRCYVRGRNIYANQYSYNGSMGTLKIFDLKQKAIVDLTNEFPELQNYPELLEATIDANLAVLRYIYLLTTDKIEKANLIDNIDTLQRQKNGREKSKRKTNTSSKGQ